MKYVVLGGNGFIGSYVVDILISKGHEVTVFDLGSEKFRQPLSDVKYVFGDINNQKLVESAFKGKDVLIHCISTTVPITSNQNIEFDIESNLINSVKLFRTACEKNIKRIVYLSSGGAVYGEPEIVPIKEDSSTNPISSYGITKLAIEKYLAYFSLNYGVEYNIIRPSNPYGPRQNPFSNQGVISVFLGKVFQKQNLEVWGDGNISKDYVFITDLADAIYEASICTSNGEIFNIGSGKGTSINEIISTIKNVCESNFEVQYLESNKFDVQHICLDIEKAKKDLLFSPKVNLMLGISETWAFLEKIK
ncbi:NAD-dependent epimerase/dehydratase family protein [Chryseobacterium wangxinyae]|uniref:NAD-dependent epimerase/dehydratase family protein n=1 Tax=Chryseobacterium sp. CY350 TaxID=2997336 RepID=UPI00226DAF14|nr:NAD-dependent epimerase/dehydratase family protein [Chryseobacterium sp. CY350]MCY0979377.1 NAD-dependent epimerase/dehydratase family protein [Chryseobacterium sp. CY350]WBZ97127.1 NAD-dependent epimerase/dehydratase family protein [Chryseobacterium sp. CY350]